MTSTIRIAHRGASGYAPENTLKAFAKALELNAAMIELDVHVCASTELVVIHDDTLERTTNGEGEVAEKSLDELKALDAGEGERIPTLREVLDLVDRKAQVNIELKGRGTLKPVLALIEEYVGKGWTYADFLVSSFNHHELWQLKELQPAIRTGALITMVPPGFADFAKEMQAFSVHVAKEAVTQGFIDDIHKRELKVFVYAVDEPAEIAALKTAGIDGIFSNFPDRV